MNGILKEAFGENESFLFSFSGWKMKEVYDILGALSAGWKWNMLQI